MIASQLRVPSVGGHRLPALVWPLGPSVVVASTAPVGGGIGRRSWILNAQVPAGYARVDLEDHVNETASDLGLVGPGVGMLTAVDVSGVVSAEDSGVRVEATVGVTHPVWAGDPGSVAAAPTIGTINIVVSLPAAFGDAGLLNLLCTVTEAKARALALAGVAGTGTPTDAVTVICRTEGSPEPFGGPLSRWGAPVARAVCASVAAGCTADATPRS